MTVWDYCRENGFTLVSKDRDFSELAVLRGFPPKFIWLRLGNCTTAEIAALIRSHAEAIAEFARILKQASSRSVKSIPLTVE